MSHKVDIRLQRLSDYPMYFGIVKHVGCSSEYGQTRDNLDLMRCRITEVPCSINKGHVVFWNMGAYIHQVMYVRGQCCVYVCEVYQSVFPTPQDIKPHTAVAALPLMVQVRPRRQVQYCEESLGVNAPQDEVLRRPAPFALYHINRKLTHEPKVWL